MFLKISHTHTHTSVVELFFFRVWFGLIPKFALLKLGQAKLLARMFCQNLGKYFVMWATFLDSNQLSAKIYSWQNFGKANFGTKPIRLLNRMKIFVTRGSGSLEGPSKALWHISPFALWSFQMEPYVRTRVSCFSKKEKKKKKKNEGVVTGTGFLEKMKN